MVQQEDLKVHIFIDFRSELMHLSLYLLKLQFDIAYWTKILHGRKDRVWRFETMENDIEMTESGNVIMLLYLTFSNLRELKVSGLIVCSKSTGSTGITMAKPLMAILYYAELLESSWNKSSDKRVQTQLVQSLQNVRTVFRRLLQ